MLATTLTPDSIDLFLSSMSGRGSSGNTLRAYGADLRGLYEWMKPVEDPLETLDSVMREYLHLNRKAWAPKTVQRKVTAFRSFGKWAGVPVLEGYLSPKVRKSEPHPIPGGMPVIELMIRNCGDANRPAALIALCGYAGLRVAEARSITLDDVDFVSRTLTVRGKGDVTRTVPINTRLEPILHRAVNYAVRVGCNVLAPYSDRGARDLIARLGTRAAGVPVSSHDLRATFATAAYEKSKNLRAVQELLGHASSTTTEVYTAVTSTAMREAAEL